MDEEAGSTEFVAFAGQRLLARGDQAAVSGEAKRALAAGATGVVILSLHDGRTVDADPPPPRAARGRPKLGVTAREVTLLPRHWDWLNSQPGGASAALRRLVETARRAAADADSARLAREALHRALTTLAGDLPGYEEALRRLYQNDRQGFDAGVAAWPEDLRALVAELAARGAFAQPE